MLAIEMSNFSNNLNTLLKNHKITISQLSKEINVTISTLSKLINGKVEDPRATTLAKIANHFQVSVDELLGIKPFNTSSNEIAVSNIPIFYLNNLQGVDENLIISRNYRSISIDNSDNSFFILIADSPAMYPLIDNKSQILFKKTTQANSKQYILVKDIINKEFIVRQLFKDGSTLILKPYNHSFPSQELSNTQQIIGVAIELFRDLE